MGILKIMLFVALGLALLEVLVYAVAKLVLFIKKKKLAKSRRMAAIPPQESSASH